MILQNELHKVGKLLKPHGIGGEVVALLTEDVDLSEFSCIVLNIDGINVPFFVNSVRTKSAETDLLTIDGVTDEVAAANLSGHDLYVKADEITTDADDAEGFYADDLVGYNVFVDGRLIGTVSGIDDSTANYLFVVERPEGGSCLIPVAEEFIDILNPDEHRIELSLPEGLLEL